MKINLTTWKSKKTLKGVTDQETSDAKKLTQNKSVSKGATFKTPKIYKTKPKISKKLPDQIKEAKDYIEGIKKGVKEVSAIL